MAAFDPAALRQTLADAGVPAVVTVLQIGQPLPCASQDDALPTARGVRDREPPAGSTTT
jgi:hypothetical protein